MNDTTACREVRQNAAELALGVLVGSERSEALAHLETCTGCRAEVGRFSAATDAVLQLAPVADPPAGFEVRLLARRAAGETAELGRMPAPAVAPMQRRRRPPSAWTRALVGMAAAVLLAAGVGIGMLVAPSSTNRSTPMRAAALSYEGASRGEVAVALGHPSWMFMTIEMPGWSGWVRCILIERGGRQVKVGRFWVDHGHGGWAARLHMPGSMVTGALLVGTNGYMMAAATLPS